MRLILDVENTVVKRNDKLHLDPFESENSLVMVGMKTDNWERIVTFDHNDVEPYYCSCVSQCCTRFDLAVGVRL